MSTHIPEISGIMSSEVIILPPRSSTLTRNEAYALLSKLETKLEARHDTVDLIAYNPEEYNLFLARQFPR